MKKSKKEKKYEGFSIIEVIIAVIISSIIALAASGTFLVSVDTAEKGKTMQKNLEDGRSAMEIMAKEIRMSSFVTSESKTYTDVSGNTLNTENIYLYNKSQRMCVSYRFNNTNQSLERAYCDPPFDDALGVPLGPDLSDKYNNVCDATGTYKPCKDGENYDGHYAVVSNQKINGNFSVRKTIKTNPASIGRATISLELGHGTTMSQILETTVSFRDYEGTIQPGNN